MTSSTLAKFIVLLALALGIAASVNAQTNPNYDPDADGDGCVSITDMLELLSRFGECETIAVTFTVDMSDVSTIAEEGLHLIGTWQLEAETPLETSMSDNGDGTWSLTLALEPGTYEFIFNNGVSGEGIETSSFTDCGLGWRVETFGEDNFNYFTCFNLCPGETCIPEPSWQCGDGIWYSGKTYSTVAIGNQCWFAENLATTSYSNGDPINQPTNLGEWYAIASEEGATIVSGEGAEQPCSEMPECCPYQCDECDCDCYYSDYGNPEHDPCMDQSPEYTEFIWGRFYNLVAILDARNVCPVGWHVPTFEDWMVVIDQMGGPLSAGHQMMDFDYWDFNSFYDQNEFGFSARPAGYLSPTNWGHYASGGEARWWASTGHPDQPAANPASMRIGWSNPGIFWNNDFPYPNDGKSVRCLRD